MANILHLISDEDENICIVLMVTLHDCMYYDICNKSDWCEQKCYSKFIAPDQSILDPTA